MEDGEVLLNPLYRFEETGEAAGKVIGDLQPSGNALRNQEKLRMAGMSYQLLWEWRR
ncbi:type II/IV secretion system ATP hydrolase TadA/VirB11/CpaF, TadA subfamily [Paenibacillus pini JCM 16418]|uniref:Type II/IV secretion system ATP hydrolase TadA/VirB11/CpaF, TadA subfamily n=1 Tax=Paenibacillus pini JCM 16418 TaxID=1236976 RepID=W7Z1G4_9BACL|nr:type II/IV secretion system ATP hydrolase TadA/VirB11/CpaF, TadA subfamily [Paenibacillus pini JCM 16418]